VHDRSIAKPCHTKGAGTCDCKAYAHGVGVLVIVGQGDKLVAAIRDDTLTIHVRTPGTAW
jgi:hypothetical protein